MSPHRLHSAVPGLLGLTVCFGLAAPQPIAAEAPLTAVRPPRRFMAGQQIVVRERPVKLCQLIGDLDRERQQPTPNLTQTRWRLAATDLGVSFTHQGKRFTLFGDTVGAVGGARDAIAWSSDTDPSDCLALEFIHDAEGTYLPITIPGIGQGGFDVPLDGTSVAGRMLVYHTTDAWFDAQGQAHMGRSVVAASDDDGRSFTLLGELSRRHFINVSVVEVEGDGWPGLPDPTVAGLVLFGSGDYRRSSVRLAWQPAAAAANPSSLLFFTGPDEAGEPRWSTSEDEATALFDQPCVGELSVTYNPHIASWVLLYNCGGTVQMRAASLPWGPWSPPQVLFDPWSDGGYCHFMHVSWLRLYCDQVSDPGHELVSGGAYGPYQIEDLATGGAGRTTIFFTLSTWNPYTVVLMTAGLERVARGAP